MGFLDRIFGSRRTPPTGSADSPVLQAVISIPEAGEPQVGFTPTEPSSDDLALIALCYAAKIGWLIELEPQVRDIFFLMADEIAGLTSDDLSEPDLFRVLASADSIAQGLERTAAAVPGGEAFSISLYRSGLTSERGSHLPQAWVTNDIPQPGLAPNLPWSAFLLVRSVWSRLSPVDRRRLAQALEQLTRLLNHDGTISPGNQPYLRTLFLLATRVWVGSDSWTKRRTPGNGATGAEASSVNPLDDPRDGEPLTPELEASLATRSRLVTSALRPSLLFLSDGHTPRLSPISQHLAQRFLVDHAGAMGWPLLFVLGIGVYQSVKGDGILTWPLIIWPLVSVVVLLLSGRHLLLLIDGRRAPTPLANMGWYLALTAGPYLLGLALALVHLFEAVSTPSLIRLASFVVTAVLSYSLVKHTRLIQEFQRVIVDQVTEAGSAPV